MSERVLDPALELFFTELERSAGLVAQVLGKLIPQLGGTCTMYEVQSVHDRWGNPLRVIEIRVPNGPVVTMTLGDLVGLNQVAQPVNLPPIGTNRDDLLRWLAE